MATRPRLTKSRSSSVPLYSIDSRSGLRKHQFEHSPRIWIITNVTDVRAIPRDLRAIVPDERRIVRDLSEWSKVKGSAASAIVWFAGERLLEGTASGLLRSLHSENRRSFVVVETPCVQEIPYLTVQPRVFANAATVDYWSLRTRIESVGTLSARTMVDSTRPVEPWVELVDAISSEKNVPGTGVESLLRLWETRGKLPDIITALVLRNLVAVMLQHRESANARKFLEAGATLFPAYAELHYLAALLAIRERRFGEALPLLQHAKSCSFTFPGSGGENSYRSDWLLGVLAAQVGNDRAAFQYFLAGVKCSPLFEPSLTELLKLQLPRSLIEGHQYVFARAARLNPDVRKKISEYLSTHGVRDAVRRIKETIPLDTSQQENLENQLVSSAVPVRAAAQHTFQRSPQGEVKPAAGVVFDGPFFEYSSLARVNRAIASALLSSDEFEICLEPSAAAGHPARLIPDGATLTQAVRRQLHQTNLTIRHQWPPNFRRPETGKLAVILPWEYGGVPRVWIEQIEENVDELWVPSNFVREVFVQNGVDAERVAVIPNGYDPRVFKPEGPRFRPQGSRDFVFLFVGGAIQRKGIDLLLYAYKTALSADDNVTLVLLVSGSSAAYQHNSLIADVRAAAVDSTRAHVLPMFETVDDSMLASLYRGADAFVLPYRGEGFGMPLLEAMACGKPVITTAEGSAGDFCVASNSYLVPARSEVVPDEPPPLGPIEGPFTWFEPSFPELFRTLRHVYQNRQEAAEKGEAAAKSVHQLTWESVTKQYAARVRRLCDL
jgi:glycosyltransferase involved in cell wall biosynthesis